MFAGGGKQEDRLPALKLSELHKKMKILYLVGAHQEVDLAGQTVEYDMEGRTVRCKRLVVVSPYSLVTRKVRSRG